jgi:hypothetical protein
MSAHRATVRASTPPATRRSSSVRSRRFEATRRSAPTSANADDLASASRAATSGSPPAGKAREATKSGDGRPNDRHDLSLEASSQASPSSHRPQGRHIIPRGVVGPQAYGRGLLRARGKGQDVSAHTCRRARRAARRCCHPKDAASDSRRVLERRARRSSQGAPEANDAHREVADARARAPSAACIEPRRCTAREAMR